MLATPPADFATISLHELTHLPYEPWSKGRPGADSPCGVYVSSKGRPGAHVSNPARQTERSISVGSSDLSLGRNWSEEDCLSLSKPKQIGMRS